MSLKIAICNLIILTEPNLVTLLPLSLSILLLLSYMYSELAEQRKDMVVEASTTAQLGFELQ